MSLFVIDDFFEDPDSVRNHALSLKYNYHSYHPGVRTDLPKDFKIINEVVDKLSDILNTDIYPTGDSFSFQLNDVNTTSWIHTDISPMVLKKQQKQNITSWATVIFLSPDAPIECGTSNFSQIVNNNELTNLQDCFNYFNNDNNYINNSEFYKIQQKFHDKTKLIQHTSFGNVYNRCILYESQYYHEATKYFSNNLHNGRLIQLVFFETSSDKNISYIDTFKLIDNSQKLKKYIIKKDHDKDHDKDDDDSTINIDEKNTLLQLASHGTSKIDLWAQYIINLYF